ncbi:major head protein [Vibrio phage vB_VpP_BT-1011]|uniref:Major capsid protein n=1 Tax=Vibrio phage vB_VpP_BT-1011 TaxID=2799672 RepID=A0A8F2XX18_9CAUD|nr:major head protein [Vibrio phage vB_VpP_BT-1011]QWX10265.1 major capsid protein [Vibrio phage vB_VpP_BT-1011]
MATPIKYVYPAKSFAMDESAIKALASSPDKLAKLGIGATNDFVSQFQKNQISIAMDAGITQPVTTPSNGTPVQFLQEFLPGVVNVLTKVRKADMLVPVATAGQWHDEEIILKTMEHLATPQLYSDHGGVPLASFNETYERRQIVRFELGAQMTQLADARAAATGTNPQAEKRGAVASAFEILRNAVAFFGFNIGNGKTYGWLNDPNLPAYVTVATGTGGDTTWASKTAAEIVADFVTGLNALNVQAGGNIDITSDPIQLEIPLSVQGELYRSDSSFSNGMTAKEWLNKNFPNVSIETVPEFDGADAGENVAYFKAENIVDSGTDGGETAIQVVPSKMMALGTEQKAKGTLEAYTNALAGVFTKRPYGVYRMSGV